MGKKNKQKIADGTKVIFKGYDDPEDAGDLVKGSDCKVTGYDKKDETYNVEDAEGNSDSLYAEEFTVATEGEKSEGKKKKGGKSVEKTKAPAKKAAAKKKVTAKDKAAKEKAAKVKVKAKEKAKAAKEKAAAKKRADKEKAKAAKVQEKLDAEKAILDAMPKFKKTASVTKSLKEHKGDALEAAAALAEEKEHTVFTLGGMLALIKRKNIQGEATGEDGAALYTPDLDGFNNYVFDTLGIKSRQADYYVKLYEKFSQITTEAKIVKIGWTKLRELLQLRDLLDKDSVDKWVKYAQDHSTVLVKDEVTKELVAADKDGRQPLHGNVNPDKNKGKVYKLTAFEDQEGMVDQALEMARETIGEDATDSACLIHIVQEWSGMQGTEEE